MRRWSLCWIVMVLRLGVVACEGGDPTAGQPGGGPETVLPDQVAGPEDDAAVAERIIAGSVDREHVAVVALTVGGRPFCSGTLVGPRTVFTAGHCVVESGLGAGQVEVFFGTRVGGPGVALPVAEWGAHPGYEVLPDGVPLHDVAYVTLAAEAPVAPLAWQTAKLGSLVGRRVLMAGYGVTSARQQTGAGTRRALHQVVTDQDAMFLYYGDGVSGTCQGDSGGPTLVEGDGGPTLVAVTSYGDQSCVQSGANTRVDAHAAFLSAHVWGVAPADPPVEAPPPTEAPADLPITTEAEPNGGYGAEANRVEDPALVLGALDPVGDVDYYRVALPAGATLAADLAADSGHDVDVRLSNAGGTELDAGQEGPGVTEHVGWTNVTDSARVVYVRVYEVSGGPAGVQGAAYALGLSW